MKQLRSAFTARTVNSLIHKGEKKRTENHNMSKEVAVTMMMTKYEQGGCCYDDDDKIRARRLLL
jgi:hypothetical protein